MLYLNGLATKQIAPELGVRDGTVNNYMNRLQTVFRINRSGLVDLAMQRGVRIEISGGDLDAFDSLEPEDIDLLVQLAGGKSFQDVSALTRKSVYTLYNRSFEMGFRSGYNNRVEAMVGVRAVQIHRGEFDAPNTQVILGSDL